VGVAAGILGSNDITGVPQTNADKTTTKKPTDNMMPPVCEPPSVWIEGMRLHQIMLKGTLAGDLNRSGPQEGRIPANVGCS
jgi:hypothetical protein